MAFASQRRSTLAAPEVVSVEDLYIASLAPSERIVRRLLWREDMENYTTMKWVAWTALTVPTYVNNAPVRGAFEGDYVLAMTQTGGVGPMVRADFGALPVAKNSAEIRWFKNSDVSRFTLAMYQASPLIDNVLRAVVFWQNNRWYYVSSTGTIVIIPNSDESIRNNTWNYLSLVADYENGVYSRLISTYLDLDLSALALRSETYASAGMAVGGGFTLILGFNVDTNDDYGYVDDARIYVNEA